ncbi:MAG: hypothetical protein ACRC30_11350 [Clostridium sp.]
MKVVELYSDKVMDITTEKSLHNPKMKEYSEVSAYARCYEAVRTNTLMSFDFDCINFEKTKIKKAFLVLDIMKFEWLVPGECKIAIGINEEPFDNLWTTWENRPKTKYYEVISLNQCNIENEKICIEITDLVEKWSKEEIENYGITIEARVGGFRLVLADFSQEHTSKILVYAENIECIEKPIIEKCKKDVSAAMQLEMKNQKGCIIDKNCNVKFDTIIKKVGENLDYNKNEILILKEGTYVIQWWLSISGAGDINEVLFELFEGNNIEAGSSMPVTTENQINGNGIIQVGKNGKKLKLVNKSNGEIQYGATKTQGSLIIFKV